MKNTKKWLTRILSLSMLGVALLGGFGCNRSEKNVLNSDGLIYGLSDDGSYYIVMGYYKSDEKIVIPNSYNGLPVKEIDMRNGTEGSEIESISIPASVTEIRDGRIGLSFARIGEITVAKDNPNYSSKDGNLYNKDKTSLIAYASANEKKSFSVPSSVKRIESSAFNHCQYLESIEIKDTVEYIANGAFSSCYNLKFTEYGNALYLGNSDNPHYALVQLASEYYYGVGSESVGLHKNTEIIADSIFSYYEGAIEVDGGNPYYQSIDGGLYNKEGTRLIKYAKYDEENNNNTYTLPDSVKELEELAIGWGVNEIIVSENNATYQAIDGSLYSKDGKTLVHYASKTGATSFVVPEHVETIGDWAFAAQKLEHVEMGDTLLRIGKGAFGCCALTSVDIPDSVISVGDYAFSECYDLENLEIGYRVTSIGKYTFSDCLNLAEIVIPDRVTSIGDYAFMNRYPYYEGTPKSLVIGESVASIGRGIFDVNYYYNMENSNVLSIEVAEYNKTYKSIDGNLYTKDGTRLLIYANANERTSFTVPEGVTRIEPYTFFCNRFLQEIKLPNTIVNIGAFAFGMCYELDSINIPNSVKSIEGAAFYRSFLTSLELPNSLKTIGTAAFGSSALTSIKIPNSVTDIGAHAFDYCQNLTSVEIPNSVQYLSEGLFQGCSGLQTVILPDSLKKIEANVFEDTELKVIIFNGQSKQWEKINKDENWDKDSEILDIQCTDKTIMV